MASSLLACACALWQPAAEAAYTRTWTSAPVTVTQIYANEDGSPFILFGSVVNSACAYGGTGLYLYDLSHSTPNTTLQNNKMALAVSALSEGKQVLLDYQYDPTVSGWAACFISGIQVVS